MLIINKLKNRNNKVVSSNNSKKLSKIVIKYEFFLKITL